MKIGRPLLATIGLAMTKTRLPLCAIGPSDVRQLEPQAHARTPSVRETPSMRLLSTRYLMSLLCMLAVGTWILPGRALAAPVSLAAGCDGGSVAVAVEDTSAIAVESVTNGILVPKPTAPDKPAPGIEVILLIASQAVPEDCLALFGLASPDGGAAASGAVGIGVELHSVAVAFVREGESAIRFGFGLQSGVSVTVQTQSSGTLTRAESFQLVSEAPSSEEAVDGSVRLWHQVSQAAPAPAPQVPSYSTCVQACLAAAHNQWWQTVVDCINSSGFVAAVISGAAVLACLLTGPGWLACVTGLLTGVGILAAMNWASCLASYIAAMAVAIPTCTVGCAI